MAEFTPLLRVRCDPPAADLLEWTQDRVHGGGAGPSATTTDRPPARTRLHPTRSQCLSSARRT